MAVDDCGNVYLTATFDLDTIKFGDANGEFNDDFLVDLENNDIADAFLVKYSADGRPQWVTKATQDQSTETGGGISGVRVSVDACQNVQWVGVSLGNRNVRFYDFGQTDSVGLINSDLTIANVDFDTQINTDFVFGFKVGLEGIGKYSYKVAKNPSITIDFMGSDVDIARDLSITNPNVAVNNCFDTFLIGRSDNLAGNDSIIHFFNPGQAGIGETGSAFNLFDIPVDGNESNRFLLKLANETASAKMIGVVDTVNSVTSVDVAFGGQIDVSGAVASAGVGTLGLNKYYYLDIDTGELTSASATNGCKNRYVGVACDGSELILVGDDDLCVEPECNNVDILGGGGGASIFRYAVDFSSGTAFQNATVRSKVNNGITIARTGTFTTSGADGRIYTVTIPSGDDIYHLSLMDRQLSGGLGPAVRFIFNWNDPDFVGNTDATNVVPVAPNVIISRYSFDGSGNPNFGSFSEGRVILSNVITHSVYGFDSDTGVGSLVVEIRSTNAAAESYYLVSFSF
jgi:hypothetical protein